MKTRMPTRKEFGSLYWRTIGTFIHKIQIYISNPPAILWDLKNDFYRLKYNFLNLIDPPPKQRDDELTSEYFDRIHPRFGLRFYDCAVNISRYYNLENTMKYIDENYERAKDRKLLKEITLTLNKISDENLEKYRRYSIRCELLKSQNS